MKINMKMKEEDKIDIIREYKLTKDIIDMFETKLIGTQITNDSGVLNINVMEELLKLLCEMQLAQLKNTIAIQLEHHLNDEVQMTQMKERVTQMMKQFGMDENTFKGMFGSNGSSGQP